MKNISNKIKRSLNTRACAHNISIRNNLWENIYDNLYRNSFNIFKLINREIFDHVDNVLCDKVYPLIIDVRK